VAKLQEEIIIIKVSKLLKDLADEEIILTTDTMASLEAVVQELAGAGALVEIQTS